jgi:hypothetical protein
METEEKKTSFATEAQTNMFPCLITTLWTVKQN